jgi:hypothetical protein
MDVAELDLEQIGAKLLSDAPERPKNTKKGLVNSLLPQIKELQNRHYTYREIAVLLQSQGVEISESTLKTYVQRLTRASKTTAKSGATLPLRLLSTQGK